MLCTSSPSSPQATGCLGREIASSRSLCGRSCILLAVVGAELIAAEPAARLVQDEVDVSAGTEVPDRFFDGSAARALGFHDQNNLPGIVRQNGRLAARE